MASYSKLKLSGSTDGRCIRLSQAATPGNIIHTADATALDEIWLWAINPHALDVKVTIEFGGVTVSDDLIEFTVISEDGPYLLIPGWVLTNSLVVRAFSATANTVNINGFVNRIA